MLALLGPDPDAAADGANNADADSSIAMLALLGPDPDSAADPCIPIPMFVSSSESGNTITGPGTSALTDPVKASDSTFGWMKPTSSWSSCIWGSSCSTCLCFCLFPTSSWCFSSFPLVILAAVSLTILSCDTEATASNKVLPDDLLAEGNWRFLDLRTTGADKMSRFEPACSSSSRGLDSESEAEIILTSASSAEASAPVGIFSFLCVAPGTCLLLVDCGCAGTFCGSRSNRLCSSVRSTAVALALAAPGISPALGFELAIRSNSL